MNALFDPWWADPFGALLMVPLIAKEGVEALRGKKCASCNTGAALPIFKCAKFALTAFLFFYGRNIAAQSVEKEHLAVVELGAAGFWDIKDATSSFGPSVAVEVTPIEKWLDLEVGTTPLFRRHSTEWGTDLVFKKPWDLSNRVEMMLGVGSEWVHSKQYGITSNSIGAEAVADFMFWRSAKHKFGWYVEPTYEYSPARGHEQSLGITGGLLISIR